MKNMTLLFLGIFFVLAFSWTGLILSSQVQYGGLEPATQQLVNPSTGDPIVGVMADVQLEDGRTVRVPGVNAPGEETYPREPVGIAQRGKRIYIEMGCMYCHSQQVRHEGYAAAFRAIISCRIGSCSARCGPARIWPRSGTGCSAMPDGIGTIRTSGIRRSPRRVR